MKYFRTWLIIGLAVVVILMLLFDKDPDPVNTQPWKDTIALKDFQIQELNLQNQALLIDLREDSVRQAKEKQSFLSEINRLSKRRDTSRPQVQPLIDSIPPLKAFIETQDSIILTQAIRIDTLESNLSNLRIDLNEITTNFQEQLKLSQEKFEAQGEILKLSMKENKKIRRANLWAKVGAVALGIGGFFLGSQL